MQCLALLSEYGIGKNEMKRKKTFNFQLTTTDSCAQVFPISIGKYVRNINVLFGFDRGGKLFILILEIHNAKELDCGRLDCGKYTLCMVSQWIVVKMHFSSFSILFGLIVDESNWIISVCQTKWWWRQRSKESNRFELIYGWMQFKQKMAKEIEKKKKRSGNWIILCVVCCVCVCFNLKLFKMDLIKIGNFQSRCAQRRSNVSEQCIHNTKKKSL